MQGRLTKQSNELLNCVDFCTSILQGTNVLAFKHHVSAKVLAKLNSTEMEFWRRSVRISRKDKIRNTTIKQRMNVTRSLLDDIKTKQLQCYGHAQRMEDGRLPKEVMKWRPPGRSKRGNPKLARAEGIRRLMGEKGLVEEDWYNRHNWRKKII
jgi:hypothetical protein